MTILPYDHQAEADTIGCMVSSPVNLIAGMKQLNEADFHNGYTKRIFSTMESMFNDGIPVDETTLAARIHTKDRGPLRDCIEGSKDATHFEDYLRILHDRRARREARKAVESVMISINNDEDATESLRILEQSAFKLRSKHSGKTRDIRHDTGEMHEWMTDYLSEDWIDDGEFPFTHALPSLQEHLGNFGRGELGIIAGYSSDGKSVYGLQHAAHLCTHGSEHGILQVPKSGTKEPATNYIQLDDGRVDPIEQDTVYSGNNADTDGLSVGYYSLEMPEKQVWRRLAAQTGVPLHVIKKRTWTPEQANILRERAAIMKEWNFDVHSGSVTIDQIRADQMKHNYDIIYIDHMHRMSGASDRIKLEELIRSAKSLALDAHCAVIALCQLSRRDGFPPPTTNQLRGTDTITQEADWVLFTYRDRDDEGKRTNSSRLIVGKARDGEADKEIHCAFNPNAMRFEEAGQYEVDELTRERIARAMA